MFLNIAVRTAIGALSEVVQAQTLLYESTTNLLTLIELMPARKPAPSPTIRVSNTQKEHAAMIEIIKTLAQNSTTVVDKKTLAILGQPSTPTKVMRPTSTVLSTFLTVNKIIEPENVDQAVKLTRIGNYSYLVYNSDTGMVDVRIFMPWHELNDIINNAFIRYKCADLTDTCMRAFAVTSIGILLCGSKVNIDTFSALLTRCNGPGRIEQCSFKVTDHIRVSPTLQCKNRK
jgi:hypothetical protein